MARSTAGGVRPAGSAARGAPLARGRAWRARVLAGATLVLFQTLSSSPAGAATELLGRFHGFHELVVVGRGTGLAVSNLNVPKPTADSRVLAAFLVAASVPGRTIPDGAIRVLGTPVAFDSSIVATPASGGPAFNNVAADVTDLVRERLDGAAAGNVVISVSEGAQSADIEGSVLAVVFDRPDLALPRTTVLRFGHQDEDGDVLPLFVNAPLVLSDPGSLAELSIAIASSCQSAGCPPGDARTELRVGGALLSSSAGGDDDSVGVAVPGKLLTVGGVGDTAANPDPLATPTGDTRIDDERYDLRGFATEGEREVQLSTFSPSGDDNLFFAALTATTQPFVVNSSFDEPDLDPGDGLCATATGTCTIRAAIEEAEASGSTTVLIPAGDYPLGGTPLVVGESMSLIGLVPNPGDVVRIDASGDGHVMEIDGTDADIRVDLVDLVLSGGDGFDEAGGGLRIADDATVILNRVTVEDNQARDAGGIENDGTLTLLDSAITGNVATGDAESLGQGGGIHSDFGSELRIFDSTLSENLGDLGGGLLSRVPLRIDGATFDGNVARRGGGIFLGSSGGEPSLISNTSFGGNTADDGNGGGLLSVSATLTVLGSTFSDNVGVFGGGLAAETDFDSGTGSTNVEDSQFLGNRAAGSGEFPFGVGGGLSNDGALSVSNSRFEANTASGAGAGLSNSSSGDDARVSGSVFQGNVAESIFGSGGAITNAGNLVLSDSSLVANEAQDGGALGSFGSLLVERSLLSGNTALGAGGAAVDFRVATFSNSTFSGNAAQSGSAVASSGITTLINATVAGNVASQAGSGGLDAVEGNLLLASSLLDGNLPADCGAGGIDSQGFNLDSDGSCPGDGQGDLSDVDPLLGPLADNGGPTLSHALLFGSPAVDAGNDADPGSGGAACDLQDQRGVIRGAPLTGRCDIGAFEREGVEPTFSGATPTGGWPEAIEVADAGNVVWIAAQDAGLIVFDTSDLDAPVELATLVPPAALCPDGFNLQELDIEGETLWIAAGTCGVIRADVSDPRAPVLLDRFDTAAFAVEVAHLDGRDELFVADHFGGLRSYDKSDPGQVVELAGILTADFTASPPFERAVLGVELEVRGARTLAFVGAVDGAFVVDVSDPEIPEVVGEFLTSGPGCIPTGCLEEFSILDPVAQAELVFLPHQLHVDGDRGLVPAFRAGLMELDVLPQPDGSFLMSERRTIPTSQAFYRVETQAGVKFASEGQCGLRVLEDLPGGLDGFEDAALRASPNPLAPGGFVDSLCDDDPFASANPFAWDLVDRFGRIWLTTGFFPASGPLTGAFEAVDFELGSSSAPACGLVGLEPLALLAALEGRRRRRRRGRC